MLYLLFKMNLGEIKCSTYKIRMKKLVLDYNSKQNVESNSLYILHIQILSNLLSSLLTSLDISPTEQMS